MAKRNEFPQNDAMIEESLFLDEALALSDRFRNLGYFVLLIRATYWKITKARQRLCVRRPKPVLGQRHCTSTIDQNAVIDEKLHFIKHHQAQVSMLTKTYGKPSSA